MRKNKSIILDQVGFKTNEYSYNEPTIWKQKCVFNYFLKPVFSL